MSAGNSDLLVDSLHAQLRALTERRQAWEHEVRTPLGIIRSNAANIRDGIDGPVSEDQAESIASVLAAVAQLERLLERDRYTKPNIPSITTDQIERRQGARLATGGAGRSQIQLGPLVREVVAQFAVAAEQEGVRLSFSCSDGLPPIWLDRVKITQLVSNLVGNALKHSQSADSVRVTVVAEPAGRVLTLDALRLSVQDSGKGIPVELLERIFERGVRGYSDRSAPPGRGIGLTVSRDLVAAHGGRLWAENVGEGGAVFHAVLPVDLRSRPRR
ncbi:MAG: sensor histidine kinase [Deltaproteobacteria bacterium]|nr:sensor histidine kinase [Deltaproteobacteria bacterium]